MNDLIITLDDGVSALVWGRRVRAALEAGRRVIAITDQEDYGYIPIGTGDGLPGFYSAELDFFSFPKFKSVTITGLDDPLLLATLKSEAPGSLIAWNMDLFETTLKKVESTGRNELFPDAATWSPIHEHLTSGRFDNLFQYYKAYSFESDPPAQARLKEMNFHSISAWNLASGACANLTLALRPEAASQLKRATPSKCCWGVLEGSEYRQREFEYREFAQNPNAYPGL